MKNIELRTIQVNLYDCVHPLMTDYNEMNLFLTNLVRFIGMNIISENFVKQSNPNSFHYNPSDKDVSEHGITGSVILVESHAAAHSWPNSKFLNVVITSCKDYDPKLTALWIVGYTKSKVYKFDTIKF